MFNKSQKLRYIIKTVSSENPIHLQNLLNEMAEDGWELYSISEVETEDEGFNLNCIFVKSAGDNNSFDDLVNITAFKSQMEKMLSAKPSPYDTCKEIQAKIREQKQKVSKYKKQLDLEDAGSSQRKNLNEKMSASLRELDVLQQKLVKAISPDVMYSSLQGEKFSIHLNEEILEFVSLDSEADLLSETVKVREKLTNELGYVIPKIVFKDDEVLAPYEFSINVRGLSVLNSFVYPKYLMYFVDDLKIKGKKKDYYYDTDVITNKKTVWIPEDKTKDFWVKGLTPSEYIARAVEFVSVKYVDDLLDYDEINKYIDAVAEKNSYLVENIIPDYLSLSELKYILVNLIKERVSIKDIVYLFEKINDYIDEGDREGLLEKIRYSCSRYIVNKYADNDKAVHGYTMLPKTIENIFGEIDAEDNIIRLNTFDVEKTVLKLYKLAKKDETDNIILVVPMEIRHLVFNTFSKYFNNLVVLAIEEVTNYYEFVNIGEV